MHILATISTGKKLERRKLGGKGIRMDSFGASEVSSREREREREKVCENL